MKRHLLASVAAILALVAASAALRAAADEPKHGGILRMYHRESPASMSIHEEATYSTNVPFMPVFNNLVVFDQNVAQNSWIRSCRTWRRAGRGARTTPS